MIDDLHDLTFGDLPLPVTSLCASPFCSPTHVPLRDRFIKPLARVATSTSPLRTLARSLDLSYEFRTWATPFRECPSWPAVHRGRGPSAGQCIRRNSRHPARSSRSPYN